MNNGVILFAHNNGFVDYWNLAVVCASRIKKKLNLPVSLITDPKTLHDKKQLGIFDEVIVVEVDNKNTRVLNDKHQPFINQTRTLAYELTPYDSTLVLDTDYMVNSDRLNNYWNLDESFLMAGGVINDNSVISNKTMKMKWATSIMFKKDKIAESIFNQAKHIEQNYSFYADLYGFRPDNYRNDHTFTIAEHIVKGLNSNSVSLPNILFLDNTATVLKIDKEYVVANINDAIVKLEGIDLHFFDKTIILDNQEKFLI